MMVVILDNLRSALNVGSIIRTCDGLGIKNIYFCGITPNPNDKKVLKTSLGAEKNIKPQCFKSTQEVIDKLKSNGIKIISLEISKNSTPINQINPKGKIALIVGNEVSGISEDILNQSDSIVHIPMKGTKKSFNVAVAFAIAAYELSLDLKWYSSNIII